PYLEAVVREALRLHPVLSESPCVALEDHTDSHSIRRLIDKIPIQQGTVPTTSLHDTNMAKSIWCVEAAEFKPVRWLNRQDVLAAAKEYPGYHHTMVFSHGPRTCLEKCFVLTEMKVIQSHEDGCAG
ncbi:cytochrome P450, partial [Mycena capillaripes]